MLELKPCPFCGGKPKISFKDFCFEMQHYYLSQMIMVHNLEDKANKCAGELLDYIKINRSQMSIDELQNLIGVVQDALDVQAILEPDFIRAKDGFEKYERVRRFDD